MRNLTGKFIKKYDEDTVKGAALLLLLAILIAFLSFVMQSYVLSTLWGWYIVPFFNTAPLPLAVAFGITLIYSYLLKIYTTDATTNIKQTLSGQILLSVVALLFGWVGAHFL